MNYTDFKNKYLGKFIDYDKAYGAQCVDLIKQWIADNGWPMKRGNAIDWVKNADEFYKWIPNTPSGQPVQGDIIIFSVGQYGHIGVVDCANTKTVDVLNQNWPHGNTTDPVIVTRFNYANPKVVGWLHPKALDTPVLQEDPKDVRIRQLEADITTRDVKITELNKTITNLQTELDKKPKEIINVVKEYIEVPKEVEKQIIKEVQVVKEVEKPLTEKDKEEIAVSFIKGLILNIINKFRKE